MESTGEVYRGDAYTKMKFRFDSTIMEFSFVDIQNPVQIVNYEEQPCFRCGAVTLQNWAQLQQVADSSFWPFTAVGAPYYISDASGNNLFFSGRICDGISTYQCYQTMPNGYYIMRMGAGHFGPLLGFPRPDAHWSGCGVNGTHRDQLTFRIVGGVCQPLQVYHFSTTCSIPTGLSDIGVDPAFPLNASASSHSSRRLQSVAAAPVADEGQLGDDKLTADDLLFMV